MTDDRVGRRGPFPLASALKPVVATLSLAVALSACAPGFRRDVTDRMASTWRRVAVDEVPVLLPPDRAASAIGARERHTGELYRSWQVVLANPTPLPGENRLSVDAESVPTWIFSALDRPPRPFPVPLYTEQRLEQTLEREFPGLDAAIADVGRRNRYGDYDYAIAYGTGVVCVLAWQLIEDRTRVLPETLAAIRLEWRVCGNGRTVEPLLQPFERLRLTVAPDILEADAIGTPEPMAKAAPAAGAVPVPPPSGSVLRSEGGGEVRTGGGIVEAGDDPLPLTPVP